MTVFEITPVDEVYVIKCEETGVYVVEASELELRPGQWPQRVLFHGKELTYYKSDLSDSGEDLAGVRYRHGDVLGKGEPLTELLIIND